MSANATSSPTFALMSRAICFIASPNGPRGYAAPLAGAMRAAFAALSIFTASNVSRPVPERRSRTPCA